MTVTYDVVVNNPCITATINAITPSLSSITVNQGSTTTQEFPDVTDSVGTQYSNKYICGPRVYTMYNNAKDTPITWMSIAQKSLVYPETYVITAFPNDVTYSTTVQTYSLFVKMTLTNNPSHAPVWTALSVQVTAPNCNCNRIKWLVPAILTQTVPVKATTTPTSLTAPVATIVAATLTAEADIRSCNGSCD